ncbi:DNA-binding pseudobarrel domain-containing protein [Tanacetum coccineum]
MAPRTYPSFFKIIVDQPRPYLRLPKKFVGLPGIDREGTITMKNQDGKEWKLGVRRDKSYWTRKFITSERKLCLSKVTKKNLDTEAVKRTQEPQKCQHGGRVNVESEDESVEVVKRGRGRPHKHAGRVDVECEDESVEVVKRGRGRPRKQ